MKLLLVRHGQTIDNVHGAIGTVVPGPGLTPLGQQQAAAVPAALAGEQIDAIYVSTMRRTHETAAPLAKALGIEPRVIDGLQEVTAGEIEGRNDEEAIRTYMTTIFTWWKTLDARVPGGEDGNEFYARYTAAVGRIAAEHPEGTVVVFSHGAAIRAWSSYASSNIDAGFSRSHPLENTAVVRLEGSPDRGWITTFWAGEPLGGVGLDDASAPDPTAQALG